MTLRGILHSPHMLVFSTIGFLVSAAVMIVGSLLIYVRPTNSAPDPTTVYVTVTSIVSCPTVSSNTIVFSGGVPTLNMQYAASDLSTNQLSTVTLTETETVEEVVKTSTGTLALSTPGPYYYVGESATSSFFNGAAPMPTDELVTETSTFTVSPVPAASTRNLNAVGPANAEDSSIELTTTIHLTFTTTVRHTTTETPSSASGLSSGPSSLSFTGSGFGGWNSTTLRAVTVKPTGATGYVKDDAIQPNSPLKDYAVMNLETDNSGSINSTLVGIPYVSATNSTAAAAASTQCAGKDEVSHCAPAQITLIDSSLQKGYNSTCGGGGGTWSSGHD